MYTPIQILALALALGLASAAPVVESPTTYTDKVPATSSTSSAASKACTPPPTPDPALFQKLISAPTAVDRLELLSDDDFVFTADDPCRTEGVTQGKGGRTVKIDRETFPALISHGGSMTIGFLGPCGFNTPHVHPRAAEINLVVEGSLFASVTAENGARHMNHTLKKWQLTVFPQGAIHTEFNTGCEPATFVAAFADEDPGVSQIAQGYFGLENEIVKGSAGGDLSIEGADIDMFRTAIPANVAKGVDACLAKCGILKR